MKKQIDAPKWIKKHVVWSGACAVSFHGEHAEIVVRIVHPGAMDTQPPMLVVERLRSDAMGAPAWVYESDPIVIAEAFSIAFEDVRNKR